MSEIIDCMVFIVQKTCWSLWKFVEFIGLRILDLLGLIFNVLACATIIRLPCMIRQLIDLESMAEWRYVGLVHLLIFLMDVPVIIMGLITLILTLGLITIPFIKKIKRKKVKCDYTHVKHGIYFGGFKLRKIVVTYFVRVICDMFCIPLGFLCLCSWRSCIFIRKIKKVDKWDNFEWRKICFVQFVHLMLDIPCVICGIFLLFTWRGCWFIHRMRKLNKENDFEWNTDRFRVFIEILTLVADVFFFALAVVVLVTWRGPLMIYEIINMDTQDLDDEEECFVPSFEWIVKWKIAKNFGLIFVDIPCIIFAFIIMITFWRFPRFVRKCTKDQWELRGNCVKQFALLLVDFGFLLMNIFCLILSVLVIITLWRAYPLIKDFKKYFKQRSEIGQPANDNEGEQQEQQEQHRNKKRINKLKNANSWKIRKAIFKHFGFLFIDVPAIAVCLIILVTLFRFPKLLARLLQVGDFYMEFALIAFGQLVKLFVDIVFFILFIILMILRPIQSWVHLLEDEEHRKYRLLKFYMQWVPDIIDKRHQMYRKMEEVFSSSLKNKLSSLNVRIELSLINAEFLKDLQWVRDKIAKYDLDGEYNHLLRIIQFYEGKRAYKMERLYRCELNYLHCVDAVTHNENLIKFRNEMIHFESQVDSAIQALQRFEIQKVPLWSAECGLKTRTREETQKVLIKCLPSGRFLITILILINLLLIYRGPTLIRNLCHRWYDRRKIVLTSLKEYLRDFVTLLIILLVVITLYRAPFLLIEISNDIISKRSWKAVRETVRRYPPKFAKDLIDFVLLLVSWKTIRFIFTTMVFGLLMPADLFLTVMKYISGNLCMAGFFTVLLYIVFFGFPFILSFAIVPALLPSASGSIITACIVVFGILLISILILAAVLIFKNRADTFSVRPKAYDYVRFNWTNSHTVVFEIVEFLQLLALVFVVPGIPMYGSTTLNQASQYLLLSFSSFELKFWMTTVLFILWFFICGLPVIFEQVLETFEKGTFAKQISWTLLVSLFTNTLFVTMIESFLAFVSCNYSATCPANSGNLTNHTNCSTTVLYDDPGLSCWSGAHSGIATFGLLGLVWYTTTAIIFGTRYGDSDHPSLDLKFSPIYNTLINFAKALMVGVSVLGVANHFVVFALLIVLNLAALVFTLCFRRVVGFMLSNSFVLIMWRIVSFVCAAIAAVSAIIAKQLDDKNSLVPLCIFLGGTGVILVVAIIVSVIRVVRRALTPIEHKRKEFRTCMKQLEERLSRDNLMVNSWQKNRKRWRRLVTHVYETQNTEKENSVTRQVDLSTEILPLPAPPDLRNNGNRVSLDTTNVRSSLYEIQNLPPPPSYQELFPHIMNPIDALPPPPPYIEQDLPSESVPFQISTSTRPDVPTNVTMLTTADATKTEGQPTSKSGNEVKSTTDNTTKESDENDDSYSVGDTQVPINEVEGDALTFVVPENSAEEVKIDISDGEAPPLPDVPETTFENVALDSPSEAADPSSFEVNVFTLMFI